jgi:hypothetical protein
MATKLAQFVLQHAGSGTGAMMMGDKPLRVSTLSAGQFCPA